MKVIGITGGVGSGKSDVLAIMEQEYGAEVIQADLVAKKLMEPGEAGYQEVVSAFGDTILREDNQIDRSKFSELMFHDKGVIQKVDDIIHPKVWLAIKEQICQSDAKLVVVEAALLGENHSDIYDELWYVYTSEENRIQRLAGSRGYTREKSMSIMTNQPTEDEFRSLADYTIDNNGSIEETRQQLETILNHKGR